jgi:hypothetical protein
MDRLSLPRHAVAGYIKLARLPLDTTVKLAGRGERGKLVVDRAGAAARDVAGATLGDDELRRDAQLRRAATDERERAHDLRDAGEQRERDADERYAERKQTAAGRRRQASQRAGPKRRTAEQRHDATAARSARPPGRGRPRPTAPPPPSRTPSTRAPSASVSRRWIALRRRSSAATPQSPPRTRPNDSATPPHAPRQSARADGTTWAIASAASPSTSPTSAPTTRRTEAWPG